MLRRMLLYLSRSERAQRWVLAMPGAQRMARQFVAGETLAQGVEAVRALQGRGMLATLDHLGENVRTVDEARAARDAYLNVLREIARLKLPSTISVKLTQLGLDLSNVISEDGTESIGRENLRTLVEQAEQMREFVEVDMESSAYTDRTLRLVMEMRQSSASVGAVIQAYLYRSENDVRELLKMKTSIRLCKGAYNEPPEVAFPRKDDVDTNYLHLLRMLLESGLYHRIATHNPRLIEAAKRMASELGLGKDRFEFQMLYGVRRDLQEQLAKDGYRVRIYTPFGRAWFAYFMRRLAERPANVWFALRSALR